MTSPDGPYFDDLVLGKALPQAPAITFDSGMRQIYQSVTGDPLAIALATTISNAITGNDIAVVNPALVLQVCIGQSTVATRRVIANLFYRGVRLHRLVLDGDTLTTTVTVTGLRETTRRAETAPRGMALLSIHSVDQHGRVVADFERCALLPFRNPDSADTGHHDDVGDVAAEADLNDWESWTPVDWNLAPLGAPTPWAVGETRIDPLRDTVSGALALVRLTQNQAAIHRDATRSATGRRLVYGGHTIALAQASLIRQCPTIATVLGWQSCDHTGPVYEGDLLESHTTLDSVSSVHNGRLMAFRVDVVAIGDEPRDVLRWRPVIYAA